MASLTQKAGFESNPDESPSRVPRDVLSSTSPMKRARSVDSGRVQLSSSQDSQKDNAIRTGELLDAHEAALRAKLKSLDTDMFPLKRVRSFEFGGVLARSSRQKPHNNKGARIVSKCGCVAGDGCLCSGLQTGENNSEPSPRFVDGSWTPDLDRAGVEAWRGISRESLPEEPDLISRLFGSLTLGKLSVFVLFLATVGEFANQIHGQIHRLDSPELYDALSSEVIRPAYHYQSVGSSLRPRLGLGSAAISSVTEALSPILPFTGGVDLLREVNEANLTSTGWLETVGIIWSQIQVAFSNGGDSASSASDGNIGSDKSHQPNRRVHIKHVPAVSAHDPFVGLDEIADLTLGDVAVAFRYALESSTPGFNEGRFVGSQTLRLKKVVVAMQEAVAKSRGRGVKPTSLTSTAVQYGGIDALKFCAAMRIFAEWRILRLVPEGYKGYAVGMNLGHKDVVQNLAKIEQAAHVWIDNNATTSSEDIQSPTLNDLLQYESEFDVHPKRPVLKDRTGAMGVLWVRRQLQYQTLVFENTMKVPKQFATTVGAVSDAYKSVYDRFHGWAVQKIFEYSFQAAPEADKIYRHMNPHRLIEVINQAQRLKTPLSRDVNSAAPQGVESGAERNPVEEFLNHLGGEWKKLSDRVGKIFGASDADTHLNVRNGSVGSSGGQGKEFDDFVTKEMIKDAHEKISAFLEVVIPVLDDLAGLFETHNMDDPTRV